MATVKLRAGHVQPVWAGHPWVFAQAIADVDGAPAAGDVVSVADARGQVIGRGYWSPSSAIPVRILARDEQDPLDAASLARRIEDAAAWRKELLHLPGAETTGFRLIHAEGDRLAGLIVDVYGDVAAVQRLDGFEVKTQVVRGPDADALRFRERGFELEIDREVAQKTGWYFDQRENRARVEQLASGKRVLDAFSYAGGFALAAARGGADR